MNPTTLLSPHCASARSHAVQLFTRYFVLYLEYILSFMHRSWPIGHTYDEGRALGRAQAPHSFASVATGSRYSKNGSTPIFDIVVVENHWFA